MNSCRHRHHTCASLLARTAVLGILAYQVFVRPFLVGTCKYYPSCSAYAIEALEVHGLIGGTRLLAGRLVRCHPLAPGGYDPVPPSTGVSEPAAP